MRYALQKIGIRMMPKRGLTSMVGAFARHPFSRKVIKMYVRHYGIDPAEAELPLDEYPNLTSFFSRGLKPGSRPLHTTGVISPVDGTVSDFGMITNRILLQAKGHRYALSALLGSESESRTFEGGHYITLYLSPKDYHRIHMPLDGTVVAWRFIPGSLYPVNSIGVNHVPGLFAKNERLVTLVETAFGQMAIVKVGATIVGSIQTEYGPTFNSAWQRQRIEVMEGHARLTLKRGDEIGRFGFGSTVILVFEKGIVSSFTTEYASTIQMGQKIANLCADDS